MRRILSLGLLVCGWMFARSEAVSYLRWPGVQPLLASLGDAKIPEFTDAKEWDGWIRFRDGDFRAHRDKALDDSISLLIASGASFTTQPRVALAQDAVNAAGGLTPVAKARVADFIEHLNSSDDERSRLVFEHLRRQHVSAEEAAAFLSGNLRRFALDLIAHPRNAPPVVSVEAALQNLKAKGTAPAHIKRIAVIDPSINFAMDTEPLQAAQPGAILEGVVRLGLAQASDVQLVVMDVNPFVLATLREPAARKRYPRFTVEDLNPAAQTMEGRFDLIVANHFFSAYDRTDQALALWNLAQMMNAGGILMADSAAVVNPGFELLSAPADANAIWRKR